MLQIKNLSCARNENILFRNVCVTLNPGQALQVVGANGCGKTTLLRTIAGLWHATSGKINMDDAHVCYVGHKPGLHPDLTVQQNLEFMYTLETAPIANVDYALDYFALKPKSHVKCGELSAGQMQRVSLARLLFSSAWLWLLDEPLANLDAQATCMLGNVCKKHLTALGALVIATHNSLDFAPHNITTLELAQYT